MRSIAVSARAGNDRVTISFWPGLLGPTLESEAAGQRGLDVDVRAGFKWSRCLRLPWERRAKEGRHTAKVSVRSRTCRDSQRGRWPWRGHFRGSRVVVARGRSRGRHDRLSERARSSDSPAPRGGVALRLDLSFTRRHVKPAQKPRIAGKTTSNRSWAEPRDSPNLRTIRRGLGRRDVLVPKRSTEHEAAARPDAALSSGLGLC